MNTLPYRILAIDMDGTALNSSNTLSPANRRALARATAAGVAVVPATGRLYAGLPGELDAVPGIRYFLCSNGAVVYDRPAHRILHQVLLPSALAVSALHLLAAHGGMADVYMEGRAYTSRERYENPLACGVLPGHVGTFLHSRTPVEDLAGFVAGHGRPVEKIFSIFHDMCARAACWDRLTADTRLAVTTSYANAIEITDRAATKGGGLRALSAYLHVPQAQIMAVGDGHNDIPMLDWAGLGVAMGNAAGSVKNHADALTGGCDADGLAQAIDRWILFPAGQNQISHHSPP